VLDLGVRALVLDDRVEQHARLRDAIGHVLSRTRCAERRA
jgi:hypothetical protein